MIPPGLETHCQGLGRSLPLSVLTRTDNTARWAQSELEEESLAMRPRHIQDRAGRVGKKGVWIMRQDIHAIQTPEILRVGLTLPWTRCRHKGIK